MSLADEDKNNDFAQFEEEESFLHVLKEHHSSNLQLNSLKNHDKEPLNIATFDNQRLKLLSHPDQISHAHSTLGLINSRSEDESLQDVPAVFPRNTQRSSSASNLAFRGDILDVQSRSGYSTPSSVSSGSSASVVTQIDLNERDEDPLVDFSSKEDLRQTRDTPEVKELELSPQMEARINANRSDSRTSLASSSSVISLNNLFPESSPDLFKQSISSFPVPRTSRESFESALSAYASNQKPTPSPTETMEYSPIEDNTPVVSIEKLPTEPRASISPQDRRNIFNIAIGFENKANDFKQIFPLYKNTELAKTKQPIQILTEYTLGSKKKIYSPRLVYNQEPFPAAVQTQLNRPPIIRPSPRPTPLIDTEVRLSEEDEDELDDYEGVITTELMKRDEAIQKQQMLQEMMDEEYEYYAHH